jgi:hypothetical protein
MYNLNRLTRFPGFAGRLLAQLGLFLLGGL